MRARSLPARVVIRAIPAMASIALSMGGWPITAGAIYRVAFESAAMRTHLGASQWRFGQPPLPAGVIGVPSMSCGSAASCLAIGSTAGFGTVLLRSGDGGLRWTEAPSPAHLGRFFAVSCVSALRCMATRGPVGLGTSSSGVAISTNGGLTWRADRSIPVASSGFWEEVRCVTASVCYVFNSQARNYLAGGIERTADFGGQHVSGPNAGAVDGVRVGSCATALACVAVAQWSRGGTLGPILQTSDGGSTWLVRVAPVPDLIAVSCGSARDCVAAGGSGTGAHPIASTNAGVTWRRVAPLPDVGTAWDTTCTAPRSCLVVGQTGTGLSNDGVIARTTDLGRHWAVSKTARGTGFLSVVSCPSATHCVVGRQSDGSIDPTPAGSQGFDVSDDSGVSWRPVNLPLAVADLQSVACPAVSVCFAAGGTSGPADDAIVLASRNGGRTWQTVLVTGRLQSLASISCPTVAECVAVGTLNFGTGNAIARTDDAGRHWHVSSPPARVAELTNVSCPTAAFCEVIGRVPSGNAPTRLLRSTDGGRRWQVSRAPRGVAYLLDLSCANSRVCSAVGDQVNPRSASVVRTADAGLHWTSQRPPPGATILDSVSCPDALTCYAFSDTFPTTIDATHDGGAHWAVHPLRSPKSDVNPPSDLSCATSRICAGVGMTPAFNGAVFETTNGDSWQTATLPPNTKWLLGISCDRHGCVAVGVDGQVLLSGTRGQPPA